MDLYVCTTYYHIYVLLLKRFTGYQSLCDVVVCDDIFAGEALTINLLNSGLFNNVWYIKQSELPDDRGKNRIDRLLFQHRRRYNTIKKMIPFEVKSYENIYIFHDDTALGRFLNDGKVRYHLIEDSYNFFQHIRNSPQAIHLRKRTYRYTIAKLLNSGYFPMGESKFVIDLEVNENHALQIHGKPIREISRNGMRNRLTDNDKLLMYKVFGCPRYPMINDDTALLLTQPLAHDGVCKDDKEQYCIYKYIVGDLQCQGFNVVLKPHPRDVLDYSDLNVFITERNFPIEILEDNLVKEIPCVAAVSSSAVYSIRAKKTYLYNYLLNGGKTNV